MKPIPKNRRTRRFLGMTKAMKVSIKLDKLNTGNFTIANVTNAMRLAGVWVAGRRTLISLEVASATQPDTNTWIISGTGLS